jgi:lysylphosphatidylglycerol synthetase-like protein (DUF2156 family)
MSNKTARKAAEGGIVTARCPCVSCKKIAFTFGQKWWADQSDPVECSYCGSTSAVRGSSSHVDFWFSLFAAIVITVVSLEKGMAWLALMVWPMAIALCLLGWYFAKMWPVSKAYAQNQRRVHLGWLFCIS